MTKWEYIRLISQQGSHYGANGGVLDLLIWCQKPNTASVTLEEAKEYWETVLNHSGDQENPDTAPRP